MLHPGDPKPELHSAGQIPWKKSREAACALALGKDLGRGPCPQGHRERALHTPWVGGTVSLSLPLDLAPRASSCLGALPQAAFPQLFLLVSPKHNFLWAPAQCHLGAIP